MFGKLTRFVDRLFMRAIFFLSTGVTQRWLMRVLEGASSLGDLNSKEVSMPLGKPFILSTRKDMLHVRDHDYEFVLSKERGALVLHEKSRKLDWICTYRQDEFIVSNAFMMYLLQLWKIIRNEWKYGN